MTRVALGSLGEKGWKTGAKEKGGKGRKMSQGGPMGGARGLNLCVSCFKSKGDGQQPAGWMMWLVDVRQTLLSHRSWARGQKEPW